jgi:uncharacterized membrane protein YjdF
MEKVCIDDIIILVFGLKYTWHEFGLDWTGLSLSRVVGACRRCHPTSCFLNVREVSRARLIAVF